MTVIWLCPHYDSSNADNGFDIRDYRKIMREFGTMADFDRMLAAIKKRQMGLIIDLVVNHTSDEPRWFIESRSSKATRTAITTFGGMEGLIPPIRYTPYRPIITPATSQARLTDMLRRSRRFHLQTRVESP